MVSHTGKWKTTEQGIFQLLRKGQQQCQEWFSGGRKGVWDAQRLMPISQRAQGQGSQGWISALLPTQALAEGHSHCPGLEGKSLTTERGCLVFGPTTFSGSLTETCSRWGSHKESVCAGSRAPYCLDVLEKPNGNVWVLMSLQYNCFGGCSAFLGAPIPCRSLAELCLMAGGLWAERGEDGNWEPHFTTSQIILLRENLSFLAQFKNQQLRLSKQNGQAEWIWNHQLLSRGIELHVTKLIRTSPAHLC